MRFTGDKMVPGDRFETLRRELGDGFIGVEIDSSKGNAHGIPRGAHSVLTQHFVDEPRFLSLKDKGEFLEHAYVHGNWYATSAAWLRREVQAGHDVLLEIDWQGAEQVRAQFTEAVSIFILPPSFAILESRLRGRGTRCGDHPAGSPRHHFSLFGRRSKDVVQWRAMAPALAAQ